MPRHGEAAEQDGAGEPPAKPGAGCRSDRLCQFLLGPQDLPAFRHTAAEVEERGVVEQVLGHRHDAGLLVVEVAPQLPVELLDPGGGGDEQTIEQLDEFAVLPHPTDEQPEGGPITAALAVFAGGFADGLGPAPA